MSPSSFRINHYLDLLSDEPYTCLRFSPDGQLLAAGSRERIVDLYSTKDWDTLDPIPLRTSCQAIAWSPDSRFLAIGNGGYKNGSSPLLIWDLTKKDFIQKIPFEEIITSLDWSSTGDYLAVGNRGGHMRNDLLSIVKTSSWKMLPSKKGIETWFLSFSNDGHFLAGDKNNKGLAIYSVPDFSSVAFLDFSEYTVEEGPNIGLPSWSPDDSLLAVNRDDGTVRVWQTSDWSEVFTGRFHEYWDEARNAVAFSPDGKFLLCAALGHPVLLSTTNWEIVHTFTDCNVGHIFSVSWSPDNQFLAIVVEWGRIIKLYKIET
jgi:WD40 repeat protein